MPEHFECVGCGHTVTTYEMPLHDAKCPHHGKRTATGWSKCTHNGVCYRVPRGEGIAA